MRTVRWKRRGWEYQVAGVSSRRVRVEADWIPHSELGQRIHSGRCRYHPYCSGADEPHTGGDRDVHERCPVGGAMEGGAGVDTTAVAECAAAAMRRAAPENRNHVG